MPPQINPSLQLQLNTAPNPLGLGAILSHESRLLVREIARTRKSVFALFLKTQLALVLTDKRREEGDNSQAQRGRMTEMLDFGWSERPYWDRKNWSSLESYKEALKTSSTLYVGNLSFYTQESQIYALFDQVCPG